MIVLNYKLECSIYSIYNTGLYNTDKVTNKHFQTLLVKYAYCTLTLMLPPCVKIHQHTQSEEFSTFTNAHSHSQQQHISVWSQSALLGLKHTHCSDAADAVRSEQGLKVCVYLWCWNELQLYIEFFMLEKKANTNATRGRAKYVA